MGESNKGSGVFYYSEISDKEDMGNNSLQKFNSISTPKKSKKNNKLSTSDSGSGKDINFRVSKMTAVGSFLTSPSSSNPASLALGKQSSPLSNSSSSSPSPLKESKDTSHLPSSSSSSPSSSPSLSRSRSVSTPAAPITTPSSTSSPPTSSSLSSSPAKVPSHKSMSLLPIPDSNNEKTNNGDKGLPPTYESATDGSTSPPQTSPRQTTAKPARVFKRNPSFWEAKKTKNQMTLRRYNDVGIVTVTLNVSGQIFATSTNTLLREPDTLFAAILDREEQSIRSGKHIFLDRNPRYFGPILDYMRTGSFDRDAHIAIAKSIMIEAEFFKIGGLVKLLHEVPEFTRKDILKIINGAEKPKLRGLWLPTINLAGMDLTRANLDFAQFGKANLRNVLLGGASICNASLVEVNLRNSVLNHATIAHSEFIRANLANATFKFAKLLNCDFTDADLSYCVFEGGDLQQCDFTGANLTGADFTSTDLSKSVFRNATFSEDTVFENTITKSADFDGSNIDVTKRKRSVLSMLGKKKG